MKRTVYQFTLLSILIVSFAFYNSARGAANNYVDKRQAYKVIFDAVSAMHAESAYREKCKEINTSLSQYELDYWLRQKTSGNFSEWRQYVLDIQPETALLDSFGFGDLNCTNNEAKRFYGLTNIKIDEGLRLLETIDTHIVDFPGELPRFRFKESTNRIIVQKENWRKLPLEEMKDVAIGLSIGSYYYALGRSFPVSPHARDTKTAISIFEYIYAQDPSPANLYDLARAKLRIGEGSELMEEAASLGENRAIFWLEINKDCIAEPNAMVSTVIERIGMEQQQIKSVVDQHLKTLSLSGRDKLCKDVKAGNYSPYINIKRTPID